jgi:phage terminase large subunit-like protein
MSAPSSQTGLLDQLRNLPQAEREALLASLTDAEAVTLFYDWGFWARTNQLAPQWDWSVWLILAGRGFGKTRCGAEQVRLWVKNGSEYVNLIAATADDLRDVMVEGESGILAVCPKDERPHYYPSRRCLEWPNGAKSLLFTAEEPDRLRGKQHTGLWCDELAAWRYDQESWDQAMFGLRLGKLPQVVVTTTPRPTKLVRQLIADKGTAVTRGTTYENRSNLAPAFYSKIITRYEGTRLGRQELNAEVLDDNPNALWKRSNIDANRVNKAPPLTRIVVAIDPAVTSNPDSDETGIVVCAHDGRWPQHFYVLDDLSTIATPDEWAKIAINAYENHQADRIIAETNNGGDMVETVIRHQNANVSYSKVTASRGKTIRAEPIAALYEQNRVHHVGSLPKLEDQMCDWNPQDEKQDSPDRMDALVWALTELASGSDNYLEYMRGEVGHMAKEGVIEPPEKSEILVDGSNRNRCECGSTAFVEEAGLDKCFKCGKVRPK